MWTAHCVWWSYLSCILSCSLVWGVSDHYLCDLFVSDLCPYKYRAEVSVSYSVHNHRRYKTLVEYIVLQTTVLFLALVNLDTLSGIPCRVLRKRTKPCRVLRKRTKGTFIVYEAEPYELRYCNTERISRVVFRIYVLSWTQMLTPERTYRIVF